MTFIFRIFMEITYPYEHNRQNVDTCSMFISHRSQRYLFLIFGRGWGVGKEVG